jgi:hypothetical protein
MKKYLKDTLPHIYIIMHKNVTTKRATFTKAEREYVKSIVRNLSVQRLTDREIVDWLCTEKKIELDRSTVSRIRNQAEKEAEEWYIGLREGGRYIATYKERLDSLLSYQKKLHELINNNESKSPELVIRSISELHRIELSLHMLMKELPGDITTSKDIAKRDKENKNTEDRMTFDEWLENNKQVPRVVNDSDYSDEENGKYYWDLHKRYNAYVKDWEYHMFGADTPPKSLVRVQSVEWADSAPVSDSETKKIERQDLRITVKPTDDDNTDTPYTDIVKESNDTEQSNFDTDSDEIQGPGQKHKLGIHCTQCHRIYLNRESYGKHECMQLRGFT